MQAAVSGKYFLEKKTKFNSTVTLLFAFLVLFGQLVSRWNERAASERRIRAFFWRLRQRRNALTFRPATQSSHFIPFPSLAIPIVTMPTIRCLRLAIYIACPARGRYNIAERSRRRCWDRDITPRRGTGGLSPILFLHKRRPLIAVVTWWCMQCGWRVMLGEIAAHDCSPASTAQTTHASRRCFTTHRPQTYTNWIVTVRIVARFVPSLAS